MLQRRMAAVSARIREVREELRIVDDQLSHLVDDADEKSLRALVSETPAAELLRGWLAAEVPTSSRCASVPTRSKRSCDLTPTRGV